MMSPAQERLGGKKWDKGCSPDASGFGRLRHAVTYVLEE